MSNPHLEQAERLLQDLERMESQLAQLEEGLMRSHRLATLGTVAATVAHEFNNLLTPMISYCQYALSQAEAGNADITLMKKALEKTQSGAEKAATICSSMLGFARDSMGEPAVCDLNDAVFEVLTCLARDPSKDGIELHVDVPVGLTVAMSPVAMQQVLMNLVLNARDAMRRTGGRLSIRAWRTEEGRVRVEVADTGCGIPAELLPEIFKPFVTHGHPTSTGEPDESKGTGLGLAVCHRLMEQAGGSITAQSTPGTRTPVRIATPAPR